MAGDVRACWQADDAVAVPRDSCSLGMASGKAGRAAVLEHHSPKRNRLSAGQEADCPNYGALM
jgi:hypothetical protein